jgi:hypothetical protein
LNYDSKVNQRLKLAAACSLLALGALALPFSAQQTDDWLPSLFSGTFTESAERLTYNVFQTSLAPLTSSFWWLHAERSLTRRHSAKGHVETNGVSTRRYLPSTTTTLLTLIRRLVCHFAANKHREASRTAETSATSINLTEQPPFQQNIWAKFREHTIFCQPFIACEVSLLTNGSTYALAVRNENLSYQIEIKVAGQEVVRPTLPIHTIVLRCA